MPGLVRVRSRLLRLGQLLTLGALLVVLASTVSMMAKNIALAAAGQAVTCQNLTAQESDDKNYYILTATASASDPRIVGYTFDFGDRQQYTYHFDAHTPDTSSATVRHTYLKDGIYAVRASILVKQAGSTQTVTSQACTAMIGTGEDVADTLPNTGPGSMLLLFSGVCLAATLLHIYFRRRAAPYQLTR